MDNGLLSRCTYGEGLWKNCFLKKSTPQYSNTFAWHVAPVRCIPGSERV